MPGIAADTSPIDMLAEVERRFGYRPDEAGGELWVVYLDCLVVAHPDRRPRVYRPGCGGKSEEIKPWEPSDAGCSGE